MKEFDKLIEIARERFGRPFESFDLYEVLANSDLEMKYSPHISGFSLDNDSISLRYAVFDYVNENLFDLWFMKNELKFGFCSKGVKFGNESKNYSCSNITLHTGNSYRFIFPADGSVLDTISFDRCAVLSMYRGDEKWFDHGANLMKIAERKYGLSEWYQNYLLGEEKSGLVMDL